MLPSAWLHLKAVTIEEGADRDQNEMSGWKASKKNLKHLEQHLNGTISTRNQHTNTTHTT
jgi:hypothetical protein